MYLYIGLFLFLCLFFFLIFHFRKRSIIKKITEMCECEKLTLLNNLCSTAGFYYNPDKEIFSSTRDAWQREFGYMALYDEASPHIQLVFDCLPIYFDYDNKTWLIELWKGQYGINTGAELGIYRADAIIPPEQYRKTLFHTIPDNELPFLRLELSRNNRTLFHTTDRHWWLTGFCMGMFSQPKELEAKGSITFSSCEMMEAFLDALHQQISRDCDVKVCGQTVTLPLGTSRFRNKGSAHCRAAWGKKYSSCPSLQMKESRSPHWYSPCLGRPLRCGISQWKNRLFVRIYCYFTRPFENSMDKLLYLYHFLPYAFRRAIQPRKKKCYRKYKKYVTPPSSE